VKILVADDDDDLRGLVAFALRRAGHVALEARDGASAVESVAREAPDLVLLDVNLPKLDGFAVLERLRQAASMPAVIMMSVRREEEDQVRGLQSGAIDYLTKPFGMRVLVAKVQALLGNRGQLP
jgi:DNA-binding response OmpR family regulator